MSYILRNKIQCEYICTNSSLSNVHGGFNLNFTYLKTCLVCLIPAYVGFLNNCRIK